jgi:hypothetical protein
MRDSTVVTKSKDNISSIMLLTSFTHDFTYSL